MRAVRTVELRADDQRLDSSDEEPEERRIEIELTDALVVGRREPAPEPRLVLVGRVRSVRAGSETVVAMSISDYFSDERYAARSAICWSV